MSKTKNPLPRDRWEYIKSLGPSSRLFHDSGDLGTYNVGRNAAKRKRRAEGKRT